MVISEACHCRTSHETRVTLGIEEREKYGSSGGELGGKSTAGGTYTTTTYFSGPVQPTFIRKHLL